MIGAAVTGSIYDVMSGFSLRKYPALVLCSVMVPVGALLLSEPVTWRLLVGLAAIVAGIAAANWSASLAGWRRAGRT